MVVIYTHNPYRETERLREIGDLDNRLRQLMMIHNDVEGHKEDPVLPNTDANVVVVVAASNLSISVDFWYQKSKTLSCLLSL